MCQKSMRVFILLPLWKTNHLCTKGSVQVQSNLWRNWNLYKTKPKGIPRFMGSSCLWIMLKFLNKIVNWVPRNLPIFQKSLGFIFNNAESSLFKRSATCCISFRSSPPSSSWGKYFTNFPCLCCLLLVSELLLLNCWISFF